MSENARLVAAGGTELLVREWGDPGGAGVLYWHGLGGTGEDVGEIAGVLAEDGRRVVAPDVPGLGGSPPLRAHPLDAPAVAALTRPLLDAVGIERCALVGHSWGGSVACRAAAADPERTEALALLDGGFLDARDWPLGVLRRRLAVAHWVRAARSEGIATPQAWGEAVHAHLREPPVSATYPALAAARIPVLLVLAGGYDASFRRARERGLGRVRAALPDAEVRVVEGVGHGLPRESGADVGRLVTEWLGSHARASDAA